MAITVEIQIGQKFGVQIKLPEIEKNLTDFPS